MFKNGMKFNKEKNTPEYQDAVQYPPQLKAEDLSPALFLDDLEQWSPEEMQSRIIFLENDFNIHKAKLSAGLRMLADDIEKGSLA